MKLKLHTKILIAIGLAAVGLFYGLRDYFQGEGEEADNSVIQEIPEGEAYY